jgi:exonuclease III
VEVAIFINKAVNYKVIDKVTDENGRIVLLNVQIDDAVFSLVCIYTPNSKTLRNMFFKKVSNFCKEHGTGILVVGGDFNEIMQDIDRRSNVCKHSVNSLKSLIKTNKLIEVWRIYNENRQQFTWRRKYKTQASRIGMILLGKYFLSLVQGCKIKPAVIQYTDHQSVGLTFRSGVSEKGREGIGKLIML